MAQEIDSVFEKIRNLDFSLVDSLQIKGNDPKTLFVKKEFNRLKYGRFDSLKNTDYKIEDLNDSQRIFHFLIEGSEALDYGSTKQSDSIAYDFYLKAFTIAQESNNQILECEALKKILKYHSKTQYDRNAFYDYSIRYREIAYDLNEKLHAEFYLFGSILGKMYAFGDSSLNAVPDAKKALELAKKNKAYYMSGRLSQLLGVYNELIALDNDRAKVYYDEAMAFYRRTSFFYSKKNEYDIIFNLGDLERKRGNFKVALNYFKLIDLKAIPNRDLKDLSLIYDNIYRCYKSLDKIDSSLVYLEKRLALNDSIGSLKRIRDIAEIQTKYETEKKSIENLHLKKQNKNVLVGALAFFVFIGSISVLLVKNTKRKQLLAEKEKIVQEQKVENLLKEQELTTIDAMIEGQEKERLRIANDLHDDLGGLMANVKLHFNSLQEKNKERGNELFSKTNTLLDEAYEKIRAIAHAKNSGVIAKQGLLMAVYNMADKISTANKINIDVLDHGLDNRLENSLELTLFRIIQELTTNIIKHANASEATIHLTNHDDSFNIMVEDNGKGFKTDGITSKTNGMGLKSIDKRVTHLNGTLDIESLPGNGTTVIIDIPI